MPPEFPSKLLLLAVFGQYVTLIINFLKKETGKNKSIVGARQRILPYMSLSEDGEQSIYLADRHLGCSILWSSDSSTKTVEFTSPYTVFPCVRQTICKKGHTAYTNEGRMMSTGSGVFCSVLLLRQSILVHPCLEDLKMQ